MNVKSIVIQNCTVENRDINWTKVKMPMLRQLTRLELKSFDWINSDSLGAIVRCTPNLTQLKLDTCNGINDLALLEIGKWLTQLEFLLYFLNKEKFIFFQC